MLSKQNVFFCFQVVHAFKLHLHQRCKGHLSHPTWLERTGDQDTMLWWANNIPTISWVRFPTPTWRIHLTPRFCAVHGWEAFSAVSACVDPPPPPHVAGKDREPWPGLCRVAVSNLKPVKLADAGLASPDEYQCLSWTQLHHGYSCTSWFFSSFPSPNQFSMHFVPDLFFRKCLSWGNPCTVQTKLPKTEPVSKTQKAETTRCAVFSFRVS